MYEDGRSLTRSRFDFGRTASEDGAFPDARSPMRLTRYWLIPPAQRPKVYAPHPEMSAVDIRRQTQETWDRFYQLSQIWQRAACVRSLRSRLAFVLVSKLYRQMYVNTGIATDSARTARSARWARWLARPCRWLFMGRPMPGLEAPARTSVPGPSF